MYQCKWSSLRYNVRLFSTREMISYKTQYENLSFRDVKVSIILKTVQKHTTIQRYKLVIKKYFVAWNLCN